MEILSTIWQDGQTNQEHILTMKMRMEEEPVEGCIDTSGVPPSSLDVKTFDELQKILGVTIKKGPLRGVLRSANHKGRSDLLLYIIIT